MCPFILRSKSTGTHLPSEGTKSSLDELVQQTRDLQTTLSTGYLPQKSSVPTDYEISEATILRNNIKLGGGSDAALEEIGTLVATNRTHAIRNAAERGGAKERSLLHGLMSNETQALDLIEHPSVVASL